MCEQVGKLVSKKSSEEPRARLGPWAVSREIVTSDSKYLKDIKSFVLTHFCRSWRRFAPSQQASVASILKHGRVDYLVS